LRSPQRAFRDGLSAGEDKDRTGRGVQSDALIAVFPWEPTDTAQDKERKTGALYTFVRNPLTHALGLDEKPGLDIGIGKMRKPLSKRELAQMEKSPIRPANIKPAISGHGGKWLLSVEGLHYAVFRLFWNLAQDTAQMDAAERRFGAGKFAWRKS
jgi:hypothetical protein